MKCREQRQAGIASIWVVLVLFALVGMVGLASDFVYVYFVGQQLQVAADAAALGGAQAARPGSLELARQQAQLAASGNMVAKLPLQLALNAGNDPNGDIVLGRYDRLTGAFTPTVESPNAVKVVARRTLASPDGPVGLLFGGMFGLDRIGLERSAIAMIGSTDTGLAILNPTMPRAMSFSRCGPINLLVEGGAIQVNSNHSGEAVYVAKEAVKTVISAEALNIVGNYRFVCPVTVNGPLRTGVPPAPDPLAHTVPPTYDPASDRGIIKYAMNEVLTFEPGYYSGGIDIGGIGGHPKITLKPGIYVLNGAGLRVTGNATLTANGVLFYIIGTGRLYVYAHPTITIRAMDPSLDSHPLAGRYEGLAIFQARDNAQAASVDLTSWLNVDGAVYLPKAAIDFDGKAGGKFGSQLIVDSLQMSDTTLRIPYSTGRRPPCGAKAVLVK